MTDLERRLRRHAARWPNDMPTAPLLVEAADRIAQVEAERDAMATAVATVLKGLQKRKATPEQLKLSGLDTYVLRGALLRATGKERVSS